MRVGVYDHFGWAVAVTASDDHDVVDRRRMDLVEPGLPEAPIHYKGQQLDDDGTAALVAEVRASIARTAAVALDELAAALPGPIASVSLRTWSPDFPQDIATQRRVPWEARADAVMYRQVLAELVRDRGWEVHLYDAKGVEGQATGLLGARAEDVLHGPRARLGPPWTKDHRIALAAAITAA